MSPSDMGMTHVGIPAGSPGAAGWTMAFDKLITTVSAATVDDAIGNDISAPLGRLCAAGTAYVEFAVASAGTYELMFRPELLDRSLPEYARASSEAFQ